MKRSVLVCVSFVAAASLLASTAQAEHSYRKRSFFEVLFGVKPKPRKRVVAIQQPFSEQDGVRVVREPRKKQVKKKQQGKALAKLALLDPAKAKKTKPAAAPVATAFVDPEVAEGFGMGNIPYVMPSLAPVFDKGFGRLPTGDSRSDSIRLALADRETEIRAAPTVGKQVLEHYKATGFAPVWLDNGKLSARGEQVLLVLSRAADEGLNPDRYLPAVLGGFANPSGLVDGSTLALAQLDIGLTIAAVTYAQHLSGGAFEPERLSQYHDVKPDAVDAATALKVLAFSPFPAAYLQNLAPQHPAYQALKAELAKVEGKAFAVQPFPAGPRVKLGQKDPRIVELRAILAKEGLIKPVEVTPDNQAKLAFLDKALAKVLKAYQRSRGIKATGQLDDATVIVLGGTPPVGSRALIAINMERLRWLPKNLGNRHVLVNQASYRVDVFENNQRVWDSNVIVGKPLTQTSVFSDTMETVVFNPSWGVPPSIILKEYLPKLRRDSAYLDKKGFQVVNLEGKPVKSSSIKWNSVGSDNMLGVIQPPGGENALGEVKFLFPNKHAIYMHDTPNRDLFAMEKRNFSHGCVRVENPREFAEILLRWNAAQVAEKIDGGVSTTVKLVDEVRVHLQYFTAWPAENGEIAYFSDIYERDKTLLEALESTEKLFSGQKRQQVVEIVNQSPTQQID